MNIQSSDSPSKVQNRFVDDLADAIDLLMPSRSVAKTCDDVGHEFRACIYTPMITVWLFIGQVLSKDHSCQQTVNRFNAFRVSKGLKRVASKTAAYCKARCRLPEELFERLLAETAVKCEEVADEEWLFCDRVVELVDGWTVTMADTSENQKAYPQIRNQRKGCGFPLARMVGLFSLATGAVQSIAMGPYRGKETGETSLLRSILNRVSAGRILLADRYYASFWLLALGEMNEVDVVARAHQLRKIDFRRGFRLGALDQVVAYQKPSRPTWMNQSDYETYPSYILVRHVKHKFTRKGFRCKEHILATTLLDAKVYTSEKLAELYRKRWQVELHIRSIKTQMQMEHLRCKSPTMVRKEIHCHLIGFNLVRRVIAISARKFRWNPTQLSFTNALQALEEFATSLRLRARYARQHWDNLLRTVAEIEVGHRPGRREERVIKRRSNKYKLMTFPRNKSRNRYRFDAYTLG